MQAIIYKLRETNLFNNVSIGDELQLQRTLEAFDVRHPATPTAIFIDGAQSVHIVYEVPEVHMVYRKGYMVLSAFHNGISDRTTYSGLHRGAYDIQALEDAKQEALRRCEGKYKAFTV